MYKIVYTRTFENDLKKLDKPVAQRIIAKIFEIANNPYNIQLLKYSPKGLENLYKLRVGDWRVLFWLDHDNKTLTLYIVEHRSKIYKNLR